MNRVEIIIILFCLSLISSLNARCEESTIIYSLLDSEGKPVNQANVTVLSLPDSTLVSVIKSDAEGRFSLPADADRRKYFVVVKAFGFLPFEGESPNLASVINLKENPTTLGEVVVNASKETLKMERGKFVYSPGDIRDIVTNSFDILKWTPLLSADGDEVSILGQGKATIYINGRPPLEGQEGAVRMLKSAAPGQIKQIEILTMKGASASASSTGGIVNVIMQDPTEGWQGYANTSVGYFKERLRPSGSFRLSNATGKFRSSFSTWYSGINEYDRRSAWFQYGEGGKTVTDTNRKTGWSNYLGAQLDLNYVINSKSLAGVSATFKGSDGHSTSTTETLTELVGVSTSSKSVITDRSPFQRPSFVARGFYELSAGPEGSLLEVRADYTSSLTKNERDFIFDGVSAPENYRDDQRGVTATAGYTLTFNDRHSAKAGYDLVDSRKKYDLTTGTADNSFIYDETINSGYIELDSEWARFLHTSLGLRVEDSSLRGKSYVEGGSNFSNHFTYLYPSLRVGLSFKKYSQRISLGMERDVRRPYYLWMNPYRIWTSGNSYTEGNPNLKPSNSMALDITYSFLENFVLKVDLDKENNCYTSYNYKDSEDRAVSSWTNNGKEKDLSCSFSYMKTFFGVWRLSADINYQHYQRKATIGDRSIGLVNNLVSISTYNNFTLSKRHKWNMTFSGNVNSPFKAMTRENDWAYRVTIGLSKSFSNGLSFNLSAINLLNFKVDDHFYSNDYSYRYKTEISNQYFSFSLSYRFGNSQSKSTKPLFVNPIERRTL